MIEADRLVSGVEISPEENVVDRAMRPKLLKDYVGQHDAREQLEIAITAAKKRGEPLDHILIFGPPGLGKTTIANIIANEMGVNIRSTSGPVLEKKADLAALLTKLEPHDVLFIDEIHRLNHVIEEFLYPAMEDYKIDIMLGEGPSASSIKLDLPPFTLIGATTKAGSLTSPLFARFGLVERLNFYNTEDLTSIVMRSSKVLGLNIDKEGAIEIAKRSRGTPRIANRLLRRVRDYALVFNNDHITADIAHKAIAKLGVDDSGLDKLDISYLLAILDKFNGGPVGVDNIAASIGEDRETIEDVLEPFLIQQGFVQRTARGRMATRLTYSYFNRDIPTGGEQN